MGVRDVVRQKSLTTVSLPQASRAEIYLLMLQFEVRGLAGHAPWWVGREGGVLLPLFQFPVVISSLHSVA